MRRRIGKSRVKDLRSTEGMPSILPILSAEEETGISGVAVECVEIGKNTSGEGRSLVGN